MDPVKSTLSTLFIKQKQNRGRIPGEEGQKNKLGIGRVVIDETSLPTVLVITRPVTKASSAHSWI